MVAGISLPASAAAAQAQQIAAVNLRLQLASAIHRDALAMSYRDAAAFSEHDPGERAKFALDYLCHPERPAGDAVKHADALLVALGLIRPAGPINGDGSATGSPPRAE
jgi:hypothetical protein